MSGTASYGKAHLVVHSETKVGGYSLGLSRTDPKPEELKKEQTKVKNTKQSKNDVNSRSSETTTGSPPFWRVPRWLIAVLMVPLV